MSKIYIGIITDKGQYDNLNDLTKHYNCFDGLAVTYHGTKDDDEFKLLNDRKKDGFIECIKYMHHGHSMNHFLFNPQIKLGDWILLRDSSERINENFAFNIHPFIQMLENSAVSTVHQGSKLLLFKRYPNQAFHNHPHWGFLGSRPNIISIDQTILFKSYDEYCYSARKERPPFSWVDHYVKYFLRLDSNHSLLGAENLGDAATVFEQKEEVRTKFLLYLQSIDVNNDIESLKYLILNKELTTELKWFINNVLILNQFYCYHKLQDTDLEHSLDAKIKLIT